MRLGTGTTLGLLVPHKKKSTRGGGNSAAAAGAGAGAGAGAPSAKKRRRRGKDSSAHGGADTPAAVRDKSSGLYLVLDVCAGDVVMDVAPAGRSSARDGGTEVIDPGAAASAVAISGPLAHGLPLTPTDVNEAVQTFVVMTVNLPSKVRARGDRVLGAGSGPGDSPGVWLPRQAVAYMALLDRLIAAAYTWYGGELLDVYVFPPRATSDLWPRPSRVPPHRRVCPHRLEREIDTKHAALKAESRPGTGRASTRALAAVRLWVVVRVVASAPMRAPIIIGSKLVTAPPLPTPVTLLLRRSKRRSTMRWSCAQRHAKPFGAQRPRRCGCGWEVVFHSSCGALE